MIKKIIGAFLLVFPFIIMVIFFIKGISLFYMDVIGTLFRDKGLDPLLQIEYILLLGFVGVIAAMLYEKKIR